MQSNYSINNNSINFGMLYMPKNHIYKRLGRNFMSQAEIARAELTELAKNVDLYVSPYKYPDSSGFRIGITRLTKEPVKFKFNDKIAWLDTIDKTEFVSANSDIATLLVSRVKKVVERFTANK